MCREKGIWTSRSQLRPACPQCGFHFERESGYWVGAIIVNTAVTEIIFGLLFVGTIFATIPDVPWQPLLVIALVTNTLLPWWFFGRSKTTWLALDLYFNPKRAAEVGAGVGEPRP